MHTHIYIHFHTSHISHIRANTRHELLTADFASPHTTDGPAYPSRPAADHLHLRYGLCARQHNQSQPSLRTHALSGTPDGAFCRRVQHPPPAHSSPAPCSCPPKPPAPLSTPNDRTLGRAPAPGSLSHSLRGHKTACAETVSRRSCSDTPHTAPKHINAAQKPPSPPPSAYAPAQPISDAKRGGLGGAQSTGGARQVAATCTERCRAAPTSCLELAAAGALLSCNQREQHTRERRGSAPAPQELQAGGTGGADQPQKPSRAGTQPTPRATPTPLFSRNNLPTPDADAARSEPQRTWLARHLVHPPAGASENTGRFQRCPSPRTPPHGRGGTCDRSRHTPLSARKSHPPQARPPNSGRPPRLRYPPRTHSPGGRPPQEKHRPTRRSRHAQRLASMPFGGGGDSRRRNLPRQRNVAGLSRVGDLASTLAYHRGMPLRAPIARERLRACAQWGDQLRGQLGKGAETLTSAIVGTPFLRSPEHAWRCDQR